MASLPSPASGLSRLWLRLLDSRHGGLALFALVFVGVAQLTRLALLGKSAGEVTWNLSLLASFAWGCSTMRARPALRAAAAVVLTLPTDFSAQGGGSRRTRRPGRALRVDFRRRGGVDLLGRVRGAAELHRGRLPRLHDEVIGNIRESYNLPLILAGVLGGTLLLGGALPPPAGGALAGGGGAAGAPAPGGRGGLGGGGLVVGIVLNADQLPGFANNYNRELAKNGFWSFFAAFRSNALTTSSST